MRMSRGQQGIGISAAGMYGLLTTGKPVKIMSKVSQASPSPLLRNPDRHQAEPPGDPQRPRRGRGDPAQRHGPPAASRSTASSGSRSTTARGSPSSWRPATSAAAAASTIISNRRPSPIRTSAIHYTDPDGNAWERPRGDRAASAGAQGDQAASVRRRAGPAGGDAQGHQGADGWRSSSSSRFRASARAWRGRFARRPRSASGRNPQKIGRHEADLLYQAIQQTKIPAPATDCIVPIGEELILKGLQQVVPGEFYAAATRPPSVYRGNPFLIEVGLAYGGASPAHEGLARGAGRNARRERRPHAAAVPHHTFDGLGAEAADKILAEADVRHARLAGQAQAGRDRPSSTRRCRT